MLFIARRCIGEEGGIGVERVTYVKCPIWWNKGRNPTPYTSRQTRQVVCDRLGQIEDILGDEYDLDRLRELVQADREGRCVVLPSGCYTDKDGENALKSAMNTCFYHNNPVTRYIADAVAEKLTREAAEAALAGI